MLLRIISGITHYFLFLHWTLQSVYTFIILLKQLSPINNFVLFLLKFYGEQNTFSLALTVPTLCKVECNNKVA